MTGLKNKLLDAIQPPGRRPARRKAKAKAKGRKGKGRKGKGQTFEITNKSGDDVTGRRRQAVRDGIRLLLVLTAETLTLAEAAELAGITYRTAARTLLALEQAGVHVERFKDPDDKRRLTYRATLPSMAEFGRTGP